MSNIGIYPADFPISELKAGDPISFSNIIDTHWHGRRNEYAKDWINQVSSVLEAQLWWTDTVFLMPNTSPRIIGPDTVSTYVEPINNQGLGKHYVHVNMTDKKEDREEIQASLEHTNVVGIKIYPDGVTTNFDAGSNENEVSQLQVEKWSTLRVAADLCQKYKKTLTIHSETPFMVHESDGALDFVVNTVLPLAEQFPNLDIVVAHENLMTSAKSIINHNKKALLQGKKANVWMELWAKYMLLNTDNHLKQHDTPYGNPLYKCQPRLRSYHNNLSLTSLIARIGEPWVNVLFSNDHAPHPLYKKLGFDTEVDMLDFLETEFLSNNFSEIIKNEWWRIMQKRFTPEVFEKAAWWIADYRHTVEAALTAALRLAQDTKRYAWLDITYGQLEKYFSGNALQLYTALEWKGNWTTATYVREDYSPTEDFYNGKVYNIWKHEKLKFKKIA